MLTIMTVAEQMDARFRCVVPHQRLLDALEVMGEEGVDWVPVVETLAGREWLGWISSHDAAVWLGSFDKRPSEVMCRELIAAPSAVLEPGLALEAAYGRIQAAGRRRLPVVQSGRLVGVLALT